MQIKQFKLERYFAKHEFSAKYPLCHSDCDGLKMSEILNMADNECRDLWENLTLGYTNSKGHSLLREEIAKLYRGISPENILICAPEEGIFIVMNCLLTKEDNVICTTPAYQSLYEIGQSIGVCIKKWNPDIYDYGDKHFRIGFGRKNMPEILLKFKDYLIINLF